MMYRIFWVLTILLVSLSGCDVMQPESQGTMPEKQQAAEFFYPLADVNVTEQQVKTVYVPVYSNVFRSGGGVFNLAVTLILRNTDFEHAINITSVAYYDTSGKLIEDYLEVPHRLGPMASAHFLVHQMDTRGGVGANFIVTWFSEAELVNKPVFEAVMVGINGTHGIAFLSQGMPIDAN